MNIFDLNGEILQRLQHRAEQEGCSVDALLSRWLESDPLTDRQVMEVAASSILVADARQRDLPIVYVNAAFERETGYRREEVIGVNPRFLQARDRDQPALGVIRRAIANRQECDVTLRNYRKDGTPFWNEVRISPVRDAAGEVTHFVGIQQDVTAKLQAEEALRQSEARYKLLAEMMSDYAVSTAVNPDGSLSVEWVIGGFEKIFGYPVGTPILVHPDDQERFENDLRRTLQNEATTTEFRLQRRDGTYVWVSITRKPVWDERAGRVVRFYSMAKDITGSRFAEDQLRLQATVLNAAANAIVITDRNAHIQWANPAFTNLTGYEIEEALGKNPNVLVKSGYHSEAFYKDMWDTILSGRVWLGRLINRRKDGSLYTEEQTITPVYDSSGTISHFIAIKQDITERERLEQLKLEQERLKATLKKEQEVNALIQRAVSALAHDVRTPLSVIATAKEMLSHYFDRLDEDKRREKLESIDKQLRYVLELLDDLTLVVRGNLNHRLFNPTPVNLHTLCQVSVDEIRETTSGQHTLTFVNEHRIGVEMVDETLVSRIVLNLLSNAVKYSPAGGEIRLELDRRADNWLELRVRDQGVGIGADDLPHIFEPFFRARNVHGIGGTGLGLSIVLDCVQRHGGHIRVESNPGSGTVFTVQLPLGSPDTL